MKKKIGFTLAEVLISLTILGVIAAITVPTLIQRTNKQEYVSALQKTYSTLSQVTNQIIAENGSPKGGDSWLTDTDSLYNMYKKYLNNVKECDTQQGCFRQGKAKYLDGVRFNWDWETGEGGRGYRPQKLILADGTQLIFFFKNGNYECSYAQVGSNDICAEIQADLNGEKKPNQFGRDVFGFVLKKDGLYPSGCDDADKAQCYAGGHGAGCACRVLREGAMNY